MIHDAQVYLSPASYPPAFRLWYRALLPLLGRRHRRILTVSRFARDRARPLRHRAVSRAHHRRAERRRPHPAPRRRPRHPPTASTSAARPLRLRPRQHPGAQEHRPPPPRLRPTRRSPDLTPRPDRQPAGRDDFRALGHRIPPNVAFAGRIPRRRAPRRSSSAALCQLCPSTTEGFGLPPLESMAPRHPGDRRPGRRAPRDLRRRRPPGRRPTTPPPGPPASASSPTSPRSAGPEPPRPLPRRRLHLAPRRNRAPRRPRSRTSRHEAPRLAARRRQQRPSRRRSPTSPPTSPLQTRAAAPRRLLRHRAQPTCRPSAPPARWSSAPAAPAPSATAASRPSSTTATSSPSSTTTTSPPATRSPASPPSSPPTPATSAPTAASSPTASIPPASPSPKPPASSPPTTPPPGSTRPRAPRSRASAAATWRSAPAPSATLRFDEGLPLYGWQEDIDFAARVARQGGALARTDAFAGVHCGVKTARSRGLPIGYSQVANPLYLVRKGTMRPRATRSG